MSASPPLEQARTYEPGVVKFCRETSAFQTAKVTNFHAGILRVLILLQIVHPYVLFGDKAFCDLGCKS